ncbi:unnamed protein product, partial [Brassica oleracea]
EEDLQVSNALLYSHLPPIPLNTPPVDFKNRRRQLRWWLPTSAITKQLQDMHSRRNTYALSASRCSDAWLVAFGAVCLRGNAPPHAAATPSPGRRCWTANAAFLGVSVAVRLRN